MNLTVSEVSKLTGVTVRTLHYYDEIGLLKPTELTDSGYRLYADNELKKLQQIMFYRELEFTLNEISEFLNDPTHDETKAMNAQKHLLVLKQKRLQKLIEMIENQLKGDHTMNYKPFDMTEIEETKLKYADEVKKRWGNTDAYGQSEERTKKYTKEQWVEISTESDEIIKGFADLKNESHECAKAQTLVKRWQSHISKYYYDCTNEILLGLGKMYVADERFTKNIDKFTVGTTVFMSKAIEYYCDKN